MPSDGSAEVRSPESLRDEWLAVARSTGPCDRPAAQEAVRRACRAAGAAVPDRFVWMESPVGGVLAAAVLQNAGTPFDDETGRALRLLPGHATPRAQLHADPPPTSRRGRRRWVPRRPAADDPAAGPARTAVDDLSLLRREFRTELPDVFGEDAWDRDDETVRPPLDPGIVARIWAGLVEQLGPRIAGEHGAPVREHVEAGRTLHAPMPWDLRARLRVRLERAFAPHLVAHDIATATHRLALAGRATPPELDAVAAAARAVGGWWPLRGVAVLTDRATVRHYDRWNRLHDPRGPALAFADGCAVHALSGVHVPADLVDGAGWPPARILAHHNAEVRRVAIERYGWGRFVADAGFTPIGGAHPDPGNPGQVLRLYDVPAELVDAFRRPVRILVVTNASPDRDGTRRTFGLPVPADCPDALTAVALTFGLGPAEYAALDRAT